MIVGKRYLFNQEAPWSNQAIVVTKVTKTTVWFRVIGSSTYTFIYHSDWKAWVNEVKPWSGSKVLFNFTAV